MYRICLLSFILLLPLSLLAQQKTKIYLEDSRKGTSVGDKVAGSKTFLNFPIFRHSNAVLTCDSAVFYENRNVFEAFKNVHINQGDTINIYSDFLTYDGNTKIAHLTSNVRMIDKENVLTTNILDYNLGSKVGTYVEGGKIVNKDVTLTSKNGYYFSNSKDAYFRYNVVVVTPQVRITSDTLRYNTATNWAYFYGPTNIKGKEDNLYTENGAYNTKTEYAYFGKRNLYTNASKSLKGDSLYYDGIAGYGKAVRNIIFRDTSDKTVLYGQLGYYYKIDERALVTRNAYVGMGTNDSIEVNKKKQPDSLWMGADTLETQMVLQKTLKLISHPTLQKDNELGDPEDEAPAAKAAALKAITAPNPTAVKPPVNTKKPTRAERKAVEKTVDSALLTKANSPPTAKDSLLVKKTADNILKKLPADSIIKKLAGAKPSALPTAKVADSVLKKAPTVKPIAAKGAKLANNALKDTVSINPQDTVKTRIIKAYHHVRVFKTNMQAVADSLFYTAADSTLRWYGKPVLWSQGSQQTGDTIYLRLKNKKLNTLQVIRNAFVVNVNADSAKYNQVKGKLITGFFTNGELSNMFVDGNAESVYYNRDKDSVYTEMNQTISGRLKALFKNKEITDILAIKGVEGAKTPMEEAGADVKLTGFTWQPELRPISKKEVINGKPKPKAKPSAKPAAKPGTNKPGTAKPGVKTTGKVIATTNQPTAKPKNTPAKPVAVKVTDSTSKMPIKVEDKVIIGPDSSKKQ